jgi:hypothetical protein
MMAEERTPRPVFGEIMTGPAVADGPGRFTQADALDADFEVVPRRHAEAGQPSRSAVAAKKPQGMDILRESQRKPEPRRAARGGTFFWSFGLAIVLVAFWAAVGHALVRQSFPFGDAEAAGALNLSAVTSRVDVSGEKPLLIIDGEAGNDGSRTMALPPLAIRVKDNAGATTRFTLGTSGRALRPGERFAFSSRLEVPRNGVKSVSVTFAE